MKILLTTDAYHPMTNGVVISTNNLYNQLKLKGNDVKILALSPNGKEYIDEDVYYCNSYNVHIYPDAKFIKPAKSKIIGELINWEPEIIHSQSEFSTMIVAKYIKKKCNIPQVHTYHTMYEDYVHYFFGGRILRKKTISKLTGLLLNTFNTVIAPTEKVKQKLESYNITTNIEIIPTGISIEKFQQKLSEEEKEKLLAKFNLTLEDNVLVYVGRVAEEKNIQEIIDLYRESIESIDNIKLLIVGGGPYLTKLRDMVKELNIEKYVKFTDMVDPNEIYKYYKLGKVFITASRSETQGITYIEAFASGLPVVCRWDLCIKDLIVNGENGFTYENREEFMNALVRIFSDEELRKNMIKKIGNKVNDYSVESFGDKVFNVYEKVVNEKPLIQNK